MLEPRAQLPQEVVPGGVAEGVVDLLEAVEVDEHEREAAGLGVRVPVLGRDRVEQLEQRTAIAESGQLVGDRFAPALLRERPQADERQSRADAGDDQRRRGQTERHADRRDAAIRRTR